MILMEPEKSRVRLHMGVPVLGVQDSGYALGYRMTNVMGLLEYRMNQLQPWEYGHIVGSPVAALSVMGTPRVGATISATVGALAQYTYTMTSQDMSNADPVFSACQNFANGFNALNGASYIAQAQPSVVFPITAIGAGPQQWQICFISTGNAAFTFTTTATSGLVTTIVSQGNAPTPTMTFADDNKTCTGYLQICDYLQAKIANASDLAKYSKADVVEFRQNELGYREAIYKNWRQKLADYLGIPLYPMQPVGRFGGANTGLTL